MAAQQRIEAKTDVGEPKIKKGWRRRRAPAPRS
jgi:hypothetical protein